MSLLICKSTASMVYIYSDMRCLQMLLLRVVMSCSGGGDYGDDGATVDSVHVT